MPMKICTRFSKVFAITCALCLTVSSLNASIVVGQIIDNEVDAGLDFNNDGVVDFNLVDAGGTTIAPNSGLMWEWSEGGNNVWTIGTDVETGGWDIMKPLTYGTSIGSSANWAAMGDAFIVDYNNDNTTFPLNTDSYVGFRVQIGSNIHYAWAKVRVTGSVLDGFSVEWKQIAYETTPNTAINAGDLGGGTSIEANTAAKFMVYPNPTTDFVTVQADFSGERMLQLYDLSGKLVLSQTITDDQNVHLNLTACPAGMYFLKGENFVTKIVKK